MATDSIPTLPEEPTGQIHAVPKGVAQDEPVHAFNAAAHVLHANLDHPVTREVEREAYVRLRPDGTYKFQPTGPMRLEGILSYESGYTQVGGHKSPKKGHGFVTLSTSVVEGLNILDVLTADRVVAQISTEHPEWDDRRRQVPTVTFLGTRFENLRIEFQGCIEIGDGLGVFVFFKVGGASINQSHRPQIRSEIASRESPGQEGNGRSEITMILGRKASVEIVEAIRSGRSRGGR